jgi:hypothetical protein
MKSREWMEIMDHDNISSIVPEIIDKSELFQERLSMIIYPENSFANKI